MRWRTVLQGTGEMLLRDLMLPVSNTITESASASASSSSFSSSAAASSGFRNSAQPPPSQSPPPSQVTIGYGDRLHTFPVSFDQPRVVLCGSKVGCDIQLLYGGCSRLHAIIYVFVQLRKIFVVDIGSLSGIQTLTRSHDHMPLICSTSKDRHVMEFALDETAVLQMGIATVTINARGCCICRIATGPSPPSLSPSALSSTPDRFSGCGHFLVCKECAHKAGPRHNNPHPCLVCRMLLAASDVTRCDDLNESD